MLALHLKNLYKFSVRVRYAPSPTGPMHLGAVRTALFNYMFAKNQKGKFIVRIEDTDLQRNVPNSAQDILDTLDWLGIKPNQSPRIGGSYSPYIQSQRLAMYKQIQRQLIRKGFAYPCFCENSSKKDKKKQQQNETQHGYDGKCRKLSLQQVKQKIKNGQKYAIRLKSDIKQLKLDNFKDQLNGEVVASPFDDFVIVKKNGYPTFHFANVIDDWKMGITHVIRGMEWLSNTPKHIYLYKIFGVEPPKFIHLPLIYTADGKKLSKRDPTAPIINLRQKGYLPQSIINYVGLMGFNPNPNPKSNQKQSQKPQKQNQDNQKNAQSQPKNQYYSLFQLCNLFNLKNVKNSPVKSDNKKLNFFNRYYMRKKWKEEDKQFTKAVYQNIRKIFQLKPQMKQYSDQFLKQVVECTLQRVNNLDDFKQYGYFFAKPNLLSQKALKDIKKIFGSNTSVKQQKQTKKLILIDYDQNLIQKSKKILHNLRLIFVHVIPPAQYTEQKIAQQISKYLFDNKNLQNQDVYHLLRLAVTQRKSGVNIIKTCHILGKQRVQSDLQRLWEMVTGGEQNTN